MTGPADRPVIRRACAEDAEPVAELLYESAADMYDRFAGGRDRALRLLQRAFAEDGTNAGRNVVWVAESEGTVAGALAGFPVGESPARASAFLRLALRSLPPWRWPSMLWLYWAGARSTPAPPGSAFYVDALATHSSARRRGVAGSLLEEAEREARRLQLPVIALDTALDNEGARRLYAGAGFEEVAYRSATRSLPGFVALVKHLV